MKPGDGVVFDAGKPEKKEEGGRVYEVQSPKSKVQSSKSVELRFGHGDIDFSRVHVGDKLWKTDDPELNRRLRQSFAGDTPKFQRPIEIEVHGLVGKPLTLIARDESGNTARVESAMPLAKAEKKPLTEDKLREQLGRLGGTPFKLGGLKNFLSGEVIAAGQRIEPSAPRRRGGIGTFAGGAETLDAACQCSCRRESAANSIETANADAKNSSRALTSAATELIVLVRNLPQLEAALQCGVTTVYCEFEDPKKYREAVRLVSRVERRGTRAAAGESSTLDSRPSTIFVAPPRIFKTGEEWTLEQVRSCNADGYLVRNYDHLKFFANDRRIGDFSLNVANRLSADYFKNQFGLERVTASYDLNFQQLEALLQAAPPEWFEVTIHQHMPMFHMEHCVFCAFLSSGTDFRELRPPVRRARREIARPRGRGASGKGGRRLPQHRLQCAGADRRGICVADARTGHAPFPRGISQRNTGAGDADHCEIPAAFARRNHRRATLARIEIVQPTRRHARPDGEVAGSL